MNPKQLIHPQYNKLHCIFLSVLFSISSGATSVRSQTPPDNLQLAKTAKPCFPDNAVLPPPPLSQTQQSIPSLWLAEQLYGGDLLETWFVESELTKVMPDVYIDTFVTLVVDRYEWIEERYMGQYLFINRFGTVARDYGYNIRVCNGQGEFLGYYKCDFQAVPLDCEVELRSGGFRRRDFKTFSEN